MTWKRAVVAGIAGVLASVIIDMGHFLVTGRDVTTTFLLVMFCSWMALHYAGWHREDKDE